MLPQRFHRSDQIGDNTASTSEASSSIETPSQPIDIIVDKMAHSTIVDIMYPETGANYEAANQVQQKTVEFGVSDVDEKMDVTPHENESADCSMAATKTDNFEYLPVDILVEIFDRTDDIGLMHLAEMSHRFATIAKVFVINAERLGGDPASYSAKWNKVGGDMQVIHINHAEQIDADHWAIELLQPHVNHIKKITFDSCTFKSEKIFTEPLVKIFSEPLVGLTHLAIRHHCCDCYKQVDGHYLQMIDLSECRNLKKLEIHGAEGQSFWWKPLRQIIQNNPMMESLLLFDLKIPYTSLWKIIVRIAGHSNNIKELALMIDSSWWLDTEPMNMNDQIFKSFDHLESLSLSIDPNTIQLLQRFGTQCKQIKHLGLHLYGTYGQADWNNALTDVAHSFQEIESFHYHSYESIENDIEPLVEQWSKLRHLSIEPSYQNDIECSDALPLFRKCPSLQRITIVFKYNCDGYPETFISAKFYEKFIDTIAVTGKSNACIEIEERSRIIGSVTANGIIWRNKLMFWMDCDKNDTNMHLLDFADHFEKAKNTESAADQLNLLDRIFDYLDVSSLYAFAETDDGSKKLVQSYVKKHSEKQGMFIITDEICPFESLDFWNIFNELELTEFVKNLNVCTLRTETKNEIIDAIHFLEHLDKLSIYDEHPQEHWPCIASNVSHIVYDSSHFMDFSELKHLVECFPDAKTIEFKKAGLFDDDCCMIFRILMEVGCDESGIWAFKKFMFNYRGKAQIENLTAIFKDVKLQLVPIFPKLV